MIVPLNEADLLGCGTVSNVYNHPFNPSEVIKVSRTNSMSKGKVFKNIRITLSPYKQRKWSRHAYYSYQQYMIILATNGMCPNYIAGHRGFVQTPAGVGCVYEKVCDEGGYTVSLTIHDIIKLGNDRKDELVHVVDRFFDSVYRDRVHIHDFGLGNFCVVRDSDGGYKRVVQVDGLGYGTLLPLRCSRRVYSKWHQRVKATTLARIDRLRKSTQECM